MAIMEITIQKASQSRQSQVDYSNLRFGENFSDHMLMMEYDNDMWHAPKILPYGPITISPSLSILHYGQGVFEGMKAFYTKDGKINIFRISKHYERLKKSCDRMCIPVFDEETFRELIIMLVKADKHWVPKDKFKSLYIRPIIFGAEEFVGLRAPKHYKFIIMTGPVGSYYATGIKPVSLTTMPDYVRAVVGGVGDAKVPGNYAAALLPTMIAHENGYTQVLWLDALHRKYIEEVGSMNICFIIDGVLVTPHLSGSILPGVTRDAVIQLAKDWGMPVEERNISIDEVFEASRKGTLQEAFGMGTAAVISPVGKIHHLGHDIVVNNNEFGLIAQKFYDYITSLQHGEIEDIHGWSTYID
jgi:branched-chain amino acid aminotransferase